MAESLFGYVKTEERLPEDTVLIGDGEGAFTVGRYGSVFELREDGWYRDGVRLEDEDDG